MIISYFLTEKGEVRENNEDAFAYLDQEFFAVADGLGGPPAGEVAATVAVEAVVRAYQDTKNIKVIEERVKHAVEEANRVVYEKAQKPEFAGMATALVVVAVSQNIAEIGNVGDSRCYLFRNSSLEQITTDHRMGTHYLTRSIGNLPNVEVDTFERKLKRGDLILLCTDGLTDVVSADVIVKILSSKKDLKSKARGLIEASLQFGSTDNITVGIIKI